MKHNPKKILLYTILLFAKLINSHGFDAQTLVFFNGKYGQKVLPIKYLCKKVLEEKTTLLAVDPVTHQYKECAIKSVGKSITLYAISINVDNEEKHDIMCAPEQEFYCIDLHQWVPAYKLEIGNAIWSSFNQYKTITNCTVIARSVKVYAVHVDTPHTFFVGRHKLLTHNIILPMITIGIGASFGSGATLAGLAGGCFGPIGVTCGLLLGGFVGAAIKWSIGTSTIPKYSIDCSLSNPVFEYLVQQEKTKIDQSKPQSKPQQEEKVSPQDYTNGHNQVPKKDMYPQEEKEKSREEKIKDHKPLSNREARKKAKEKGYIEVKNPGIGSHGELVFKDPKRRVWITPDNTGHNGGIWKEFDKKLNRTGTLDKNLERLKG